MFRAANMNDDPNYEHLQYWSGVLRAYYSRDRRREPFRALSWLVFGMSCLVGSVLVFLHPLRNQWLKIRRTKLKVAQATTVGIILGCLALRLTTRHVAIEACS